MIIDGRFFFTGFKFSCIFLVFFQSTFSWSKSQSSRDLWDQVAKIVSESPEIQSLEWQSRVEAIKGEMSTRIENPVVDVATNSRVADIGFSFVQSLSLRQKLPFWTEKSRFSKVYELSSLGFHEEKQRRLLEDQFYLVGEYYRALLLSIEVDLFKKRKETLFLIRQFLQKTKASSPSYETEREMIAMALDGLEYLFYEKQAELEELTLSLKKLGLNLSLGSKFKWVTYESLSQFLKQAKFFETQQISSSRRAHHNFLLAQSEIDVYQVRPNFEVYTSQDIEHGGSRERNTMVGLSILIPLSGIRNQERSAAIAKAQSAQFLWLSEKRSEDIFRSQLQSKQDLVLKTLSLFSEKDLLKWQLSSKKKQQLLLQGWITVMQFLEFDRQQYAQWENLNRSQNAAVDLVQKICFSSSCSGLERQVLGGVL
jgi:hypothetical protein